MMAASPPITRGMRQAQPRSASVLSVCSSATTTSTASNCPPISVTYWKDTKKPRWREVATSLM